MRDTLALLYSVTKLRIGFAIMLSALAGLAITPGPMPSAAQVLILALAVLASSASAGAFNHYVERDLDARMNRTRQRPFVTGRFQANGYWLAGIATLLLIAVAAASYAINAFSALYVFLGAFVYGVVYTVWLKRRTPLNIVIGGLAGSFAVMAGAAAVAPGLSPAPILLAVVLFLWTPPHFWSLAFVYRQDYAAAGVPMLPVVVNEQRTAWIILLHTLALVGVSLVPFFYGMSWVYLAGALAGGAYFVKTSFSFVQRPGPKTAIENFHASLLQLSLLLIAVMLDAWLMV